MCVKKNDLGSGLNFSLNEGAFKMLTKQKRKKKRKVTD